MPQLVECVPNFSNGRDPAVYNAIADAIRAVPGTRVLNVSADPDHNRTVITFVGTLEQVSEAAFQAIAAAARLIDLDHHQGEHPRIGATDVCPFIPIRDASIGDCVDAARQLGRRVGAELDIAVYLYGDAATSPERKSLSRIRKGEYEGWKAEIGREAWREPDFGPAQPAPWGATVIGVRPFLIAYNIYLNSDDIQLADKVARSIRYSSGGLRNVQAKGFLVEGQAQVSMNLTNFAKTPIHRVQEMVRREAAYYGLQISKAELVGLIPQKALLDSAQWYLQLDEIEDNQVLEYKLAEQAESADNLPHDFLAAVAGGSPTPGGGAVAALAAALGAALTEMVAGLTIGRNKYAAVETEMTAALQAAATLRERLTRAVAEDSAAFNELMAIYRDKSLQGEGRQTAIQRATIGAALVPLNVARLAREVALLAQKIAEMGNINAVTDAAAGAIMARAAVDTAALNVRVNAAGLPKDDGTAAWLKELAALQAEVATLTAAVQETAASRGGF